MLTISNHKMQNAFFSTVNIYMLLHIYRFIPQAAPPPPPRTPCRLAGFGSLGSAWRRLSSQLWHQEGSMAGEPTTEVLERHEAALAPGARAKHVAVNRGAPHTPAPSPPAATQGRPRAEGPPQRPAPTAEAARGRAMWSPLQQQQQNQKAKIWRYSGIFCKK